MDFDADGDSDVLSGSWPGDLYFFSRNADGSFAAPDKIQNADGNPIDTGQASTAFAVDWDADGDLDLVTGNIKGQVHLVPNEGSRAEPSYGEPVKLDVDSDLRGRGGDSGPIIADWDQDGLGDLLVGMGDGSVLWFPNTGSSGAPEFGEAEELVPKSPFGFDLQNARPDEGQWGARVKIHVTDFNGDGRVDLLLGDRSGSPRKETDISDKDRKAAAAAREQIAQVRKQITDTRSEIKRLDADGDSSSDDSDPAELKQARDEYGRLIKEYARLQQIIARGEPKPVRQGFVWLFERRSVPNIAQK